VQIEKLEEKLMSEMEAQQQQARLLTAVCIPRGVEARLAPESAARRAGRPARRIVGPPA
jgi:hypothetical protein